MLEGRCFAAFLSTRGLVEVWICNDQKMYLTQLGPVKLGLRLGDSATLCLSVVVLLPVSIGIRIHLSPNAQVVLLGGSFYYVFPLWIDCAPTTWLWWVVFEASPDFPFFKRDLNRDKASYSLSQWEGNLCLAINKHALPSFSSWNVLRWSLNFYVSLKGNKKGDSLFLLSRKEVLWLYLFFFLTKLCRSSTVCTLCGAVLLFHIKTRELLRTCAAVFAVVVFSSRNLIVINLFCKNTRATRQNVLLFSRRLVKTTFLSLESSASRRARGLGCSFHLLIVIHTFR